MTFNTLTFVIFSFVIFFSQSSGQTLCKLGEEVCDRSCYSPARFHCLTPPNGTWPKLCRKWEALCARNGSSGTFGQCYDPDFEDCYTFPSDHIVCLRDQSVCGVSNGFSMSCYNPTIQVCVVDQVATNPREIVCIKGQLACGDSCYWPDAYRCLRE